MKPLAYRCRLMLALLVAGSASVFAAPRALPQEQAAHFCRLMVYDGEGKVYPLSTYANHLVTMLCGQTSYEGFTAEQVFTGLIFYYDDWIRQPFILTADAERQTLVHELHSGATMRIFPHRTGGVLTWHSPTETLPATIDAEHRRYMKEVFTRMNAEAAAQNWTAVDAYTDRMMEYQCRFGGSRLAAPPTSTTVVALFALFLAVIFVFYASIAYLCSQLWERGRLRPPQMRARTPAFPGKAEK